MVEALLDNDKIFRTDWRDFSNEQSQEVFDITNLTNFDNVEKGLRECQKAASTFLHSDGRTVLPEDLSLSERLRTTYQLRRLFMVIRLLRPFLVIRYAQCVTDPSFVSPSGSFHMPDEIVSSLDYPSTYYAVCAHISYKCIMAARELMALLISENDFSSWGSISGYERLDYVYSCGLVLILSTFTILAADESRRGYHRAEVCRKLSGLFDLLERYQAICSPNRKLVLRRNQCRFALRNFMNFVYPQHTGMSQASDLALPAEVWEGLFQRINIPFPGLPFVSSPSQLPLTLFWFESVPADLAG